MVPELASATCFLECRSVRGIIAENTEAERFKCDFYKKGLVRLSDHIRAHQLSIGLSHSSLLSFHPTNTNNPYL